MVQGLVLGPCLFFMFINDIDGAVEGVGGMFSDDTKWLMGEEDRVAFQTGIDPLHRWSEVWQMPFYRRQVPCASCRQVQC